MSKTTIDSKSVFIGGEEYVPKSSLSSVPTPSINSDIRIVVLQCGWIYIGRFKQVGDECTLDNAYNIRTWGTTKGLPELVHGPTSNTKLDKCEGLVRFHPLTIVHQIDVNPEKWKL